MRYGLIGGKLGHSYSKIIHEKLADYKYDLIPLEEDKLHEFMIQKNFAGINVTIPYKQKVIPYLNELDSLAKEIGAVNTIVNNDGYLIGYNTDFYGIVYLIQNNKINIKNKKCFVLGNGGTSKTAQVALKHLGAKKVTVVSRKKTQTTITYEEAYKDYTDTEIVVNTTPVGMYPLVDASPLDLSTFSKCQAVIDVIFNPLDTKIVQQARDLCITSVSGLEMLVAQAKMAAELFLVKKIPEEIIDDIYKELIDTIH